jgi:hypothetical protein
LLDLGASPQLSAEDRIVTQRSKISTAFVASFLLLASTVGAQDREPEASRLPSLASDLTKSVVFDPTTYAPAAILYTSMRLDWKTSQPFFAHGFLEANDRYTVSGRSGDVPVSFSQGKRQILTDSLLNLPMSFANNTGSRVVERMLMQRFPSRPKLFRTLGWIERTAFAGYMSNRLAAKHFRQWQENVTTARQLGF